MNGRAWLGLDIGATKVLGLMMSEDGDILETMKIPSRQEEGREILLGRVMDLCGELEARAGKAQGVGAGFAGLVDQGTGKILSSIMLPGWGGFLLADRLETVLGVPAVVDNDATAAGFGEFVALRQPAGLNLIVLTVGTGIGGAIILGGHLFRGACGTAGEFGNMTVDWRGDECWCGSLGCLNTLASGRAISDLAANLARKRPESLLFGRDPPLTVMHVAEAAERQDEAALMAIEQGARALGAGIANIINIFNPDRVALTGGVVELGSGYLQFVREEAKRRAFTEPYDHAEIQGSLLGHRTGAYGAAALARHVLTGGAL